MAVTARAHDDRPARGESGRWSAALLAAGVAVFALNLRPAVVALGPLTDQLRDDTGLGPTAVSLLTTLPLLCFGLFSTVAPRLARRAGLEPALALAGALLIAGCALRLLPPIATLFLGAGLAGAGIALGNVLLPIVVKRDFPHRTGAMMALYSVMLNIGAAVAAGASIPLEHALHADWRQALALWSVPALLALLLWLPQLLRRPQHVAPAPGVAHARVWRSPLAWAVAVFMGMQSLIFYSASAWLPTLLQDGGMSASAAGAMVAIVSFTGIAAGFTVPLLAARGPAQQGLVLVCAGAFALAVGGLIVAPVAGAVAWAVGIGVGSGAGISLALSFFVARSRTPRGAAELSGMAQAVGYLIAATGPLLVGGLHDATGGWTAPLAVLGAAAVVLLLSGRVAAADRCVEDDG